MGFLLSYLLDWGRDAPVLGGFADKRTKKYRIRLAGPAVLNVYN
jgi:hypothetical protein